MKFDAFVCLKHMEEKLMRFFYFLFSNENIITVQQTQPRPPNIDQPITGHVYNKGVKVLFFSVAPVEFVAL